MKRVLLLVLLLTSCARPVVNYHGCTIWAADIAPNQLHWKVCK